MLAIATGCRSPRAHRTRADSAASRILERQQQDLFGTAADLKPVRPAAELRRRLLIVHDLPTAFPASRGLSELAPIPELPDRAYLNQTASGDTAPPWHGLAAEEGPLVITLDEALQIAARNSRDYQSRKEDVFISALDLDLERDAFRSSWQGLMNADWETDLTDGDPATSVDTGGTLEWTKRFAGGAVVTAQLGMNLVKLLTGSETSSMGIFGDASITIPLMRGAGRFVVTEPMKQAQRNVVYALYEFERFKRTFAVKVASQYLGVLEDRDRVQNAEENYRGLVASARRARRLADMGRLPEIQVDQAVQDELRARNRWVSARQTLEQSLDTFRQLLGLPTDARVEPDPATLDDLRTLTDELEADSQRRRDRTEDVPADAPVELEFPTRENGGPLEIEPRRGIAIAFENRLDLRVALRKIVDAQRAVAIAADQLRADLSLLGQASVGETRSAAGADLPDAELDVDDGTYAGMLDVDLPLERTQERNNYRVSWIELDRAVRDAQELEDDIKFAVRGNLRALLEAREAVRIQLRAVQVARRRVRSTELFLEQGRAEIRDVLEARESLVAAENALTAAVVRYRVSELEFQRDLGVLEIGPDGLWTEFQP